MPADDLTLLIEAAQEAGRIASRYSGPMTDTWYKPEGAGPVTAADFAVNEMLLDELRHARPDYGWLSEESEDDAERLERERVFIIDPIDGTRNFIEGSTTWAHSLAIAEQGRITTAVIYLPQREKLYAAARGRGATLNAKPIHASTHNSLSGAEVLAARPVRDAANWRDAVPDFNSSHRPSLAYRLALVAEGRYDAMLTLRQSWEWDIAAGDLILQEAGALTSDRRGGPLRFNNPHPQVDGVIASNAALHPQIVSALA